MASTRLKTTKDGKRFYEIRCRVSRERPELSTRWYVPDGWSQRAIDRELAKQSADFERRCQAGEILSRSEKKQKAANEAAEAAKLKTFKQYAEDVYMAKKLPSLTQNGKESYETNLKLHIYPYIGDILISEITPATLEELLFNFQKTHAHSSTVKIYNLLCGTFRAAERDGSIVANPMRKIDRPVPKSDEVPKEEVQKAFSAQEMVYILSCIAKEPLKWRAFIRVMADTGCRRGECCGIHWVDIDFETGELTFRHNLQYSPKIGIYDKRPKNNKARKVDLDSECLDLLKQLKAEQDKSFPSEYVFTQENSSEPMHPQSPTKRFKTYGEKYNIPDFHPHKLRHTFASVAITSGADVASVAGKLGHSDSAVTLRMYTHANQEAIKNAGSIFRNAIADAQKNNTNKLSQSKNVESTESENSSMPEAKL